MCALTDPVYSDPQKAREHLEALHWPQGPFCPRCGEMERLKRLEGKSTHPGVVMCNPCRRPFTVTVGTIFESSKIPLNKWLMAFRSPAPKKPVLALVERDGRVASRHLANVTAKELRPHILARSIAPAASRPTMRWSIRASARSSPGIQASR